MGVFLVVDGIVVGCLVGARGLEVCLGVSASTPNVVGEK